MSSTPSEEKASEVTPRERRRTGFGKRRRAREMALQMLYQKELGDSPVGQIFALFNLDEYRKAAGSERESSRVFLIDGLPESPKDLEDLQSATAEDEPSSSDEEQRRRPFTDPAKGVRPVYQTHPSKAQLESSFKYARQLVEGTLEHGQRIDDLIRRQAENWRLERMPTIDRNILRLALYEMLFQEQVPRVVIVDEAIELAKKFGSEHSGRFVNGLLDGVLKSEKQTLPGVGGDS